MYKLLMRLQDTVISRPWLIPRFGSDYFDFPDDAWALTWSPDGRYVASSHSDFVVRVWDIEQRLPLPLHYLERPKAQVSIAWSPDGRWIATGDTRGDPVCIWNAHTQNLVQELYAHNSWPLSIGWRGDGQYLVSAGQDGCVLLWRAMTWQVIRELQPSEYKYHGRFRTARFVPGGSDIVFMSSDGEMFLWQEDQTTLLCSEGRRGHLGPQFAFCPRDPDKLAIHTEHEGVSIWSLHQRQKWLDLPSHEPRFEKDHYSSIDWSPDSQDIVVGEANLLRFWHKGIPLEPIQTPHETIRAALWNPAGSLLATCGMDGAVCIWTQG